MEKSENRLGEKTLFELYFLFLNNLNMNLLNYVLVMFCATVHESVQTSE